jgi:hypothetical protein
MSGHYPEDDRYSMPGSSESDASLRHLMWKRFGSDKPQQNAAARRAWSLPERLQRQAAVDRSSCSRLTSRRSPVRAGHRPSPRVCFRSGTSGIAVGTDAGPNGLVEALWRHLRREAAGRSLRNGASRRVPVSPRSVRSAPRARPDARTYLGALVWPRERRSGYAAVRSATLKRLSLIAQGDSEATVGMALAHRPLP